MPTFRITVINQHFRACDDHDLESLAAATREGVRAALQIGTDEVANGKPFFGAEVRVAEGETICGKFVVSVGMSPIQ